MTPDVNIVLAASRSDHPQHAIALQWLDAAVAESAAGRPFTLIPMVLTSYLRLTTNSRIFLTPTPIKNAIAFADALIAAPGARTVTLGGEWSVLRQLCLGNSLRANELPDAWLAAAVIHLGERLVTFDTDFRKLLRRNQLTVLKPA